MQTQNHQQVKIEKEESETEENMNLLGGRNQYWGRHLNAPNE